MISITLTRNEDEELMFFVHDIDTNEEITGDFEVGVSEDGLLIVRTVDGKQAIWESRGGHSSTSPSEH